MFLILAEILVIEGLCGYSMQDSEKNARNQNLNLLCAKASE